MLYVYRHSSPWCGHIAMYKYKVAGIVVNIDCAGCAGFKAGVCPVILQPFIVAVCNFKNRARHRACRVIGGIKGSALVIVCFVQRLEHYSIVFLPIVPFFHTGGNIPFMPYVRIILHKRIIIHNICIKIRAVVPGKRTLRPIFLYLIRTNVHRIIKRILIHMQVDFCVDNHVSFI